MRYERLQDIVRVAIRLQGALGGLTLDDIRADFGVSRRTAERLRDAVEAVFGPLERVDTGDSRRHWRLRSDALRRLVSVSAGELTALASAAGILEHSGFDERAAALRELATRPGPRQRLDAGLLALLREAITTGRVVEFRYLA